MGKNQITQVFESAKNKQETKKEGGTQTYFFYNFFSVIYSVNLNTMKYNY